MGVSYERQGYRLLQTDAGLTTALERCGGKRWENFSRREK